MDKKIKLSVIAILIITVVTLIVGATYAYWSISKNQETTNVITSSCFDISLSNEQNAINLEHAIPITDVEGILLTPFTFTIENTCEIASSYALNLEMLENTTLNSEFVDLKLNTRTIQKLSDYEIGEKTQSTSTEARKLETGILNPGESKDYELRLWLDKDVTLEDDVVNKTLNAKVTVTAVTSTPSNKNTSVLKATTGYSDKEAFRSNTYKSKIKNVTFEDSINIRDSKIEQWNISESGDNSIISYVVPNETEGYYDLYIQSNNYIEAPTDMSNWFSSFSALETVNGLEFLDTSKVTNMNNMFQSAGTNASDFIIDLRSLDLSKVTNMQNMFSSVGSYASNVVINMRGLDLSSVTNMRSMFQNAGGYNSNYTIIDLSNTDTSKVTDMSFMFASVKGIGKTELKLDGFDTNSVTTMQSMFQYYGFKPSYPNPKTRNDLDVLDLSSFDTSNVTNMREMFREALNYSLAIKVDLSSFDTTKVTEMWGMFYDVGHYSTSIDLTITIRNDSISEANFAQMFKYAACQEGANIIVNYTEATSDLVDQMIATKTTGCNVIKGQLVQ